MIFSIYYNAQPPHVSDQNEIHLTWQTDNQGNGQETSEMDGTAVDLSTFHFWKLSIQRHANLFQISE